MILAGSSVFGADVVTGACAGVAFCSSAGCVFLAVWTVTCSFSSPRTSITSPTGMVWPAWTVMAFTKPAAGASISRVALSVSISKMTCPLSILSPTFTSVVTTVPSSMVCPSWGSLISVAIYITSHSAIGDGFKRFSKLLRLYYQRLGYLQALKVHSLAVGRHELRGLLAGRRASQSLLFRHRIGIR